MIPAMASPGQESESLNVQFLVDSMVAKWRACVETGEDFAFETGVRVANGEYCWMLYRKVSPRDRRGNNFHVKELVDRLRLTIGRTQSLIVNRPGLL